jgi:hypothetical protein
MFEDDVKRLDGEARIERRDEKKVKLSLLTWLLKEGGKKEDRKKPKKNSRATQYTLDPLNTTRKKILQLLIANSWNATGAWSVKSK